MQNSVEKKIYNIILNNVKKDNLIHNIGVNTKLNDLGMNSLLFIKTLVDLETEFGLEFEDDELTFDGERFQTISSLINYIKEKINKDEE